MEFFFLNMVHIRELKCSFSGKNLEISKNFRPSHLRAVKSAMKKIEVKKSNDYDTYYILERNLY